MSSKVPQGVARDELRRLVERLADADVPTARRVLEALVESSEYDGEPLSPEEEAALAEGREAVRRGELQPWAEVRDRLTRA